MHSSCKCCEDVDISIQREDDDDLIVTISIKGYQSVSDLTERSRRPLNFKEHDRLSAHKTHNGERIDGWVRIRNIAYLGTVVIKCTETRANREDAATHKKHGLASIPEKQDGNSKKIRHRNDLSVLGATSRDNTTTSHQDEITFLDSKLKKVLKVEGFVFEIVPEDYKIKYKERESTSKFCSQKEYKEKRSEIRIIPDWSDWQPHEALPCLGVRINNNVGKDNPPTQSFRNRNQNTSKMAIMTKTCFYQVREFGVNVTIDKTAVKEAKNILKAPIQERQNAMKKFYEKYCTLVYTGKFSAGAWLRTTATAKCPKGQDSTNLEKYASEETEHCWSWKKQGRRTRNQRKNQSYQSPMRNKYPSVTVNMTQASGPLDIHKIDELEETFKSVKNCTVFPANWNEKSHFTPVYKIMQSQADANNDDDLRQVSDIFKECMKENLPNDTVTDMEVDSCFSKMMVDVKEKETIEKMDTQTTGQETSYGEGSSQTGSSYFQNAESSKKMYTPGYSASGDWYGQHGTEGTGHQTLSTVSSPTGSTYSQNSQDQNWRKQSSQEMYNTDYSRSGNRYGPSGDQENRDWRTRDASFRFMSDYRFMKTESEVTLNEKLENVPAQMTMDDKSPVSTSHVPYVVFLGDAGTGKSTIVEKLTGKTGRSSDESESFTDSSEAFVVPDGSLIVADTPGSNSRKNKEEHNIWIAGALNFQPVSKIFIVSKAQPRIDSVIDNVCKYADNFIELSPDAIGVLVSHMDLVEWKEEEFKSAIDDELGIDAVIFSEFNTTAETLLPKILETCTEPHDLTVNHENFAKLFKIPNNHIKILKCINDEVKKFSLMKEAFDKKRKDFGKIGSSDQIDLAFEFLTYMSDEIVKAKKRMTEYNNFTFEGDSAALEAGHVLNMVNQLYTVLFEIRKECFKYQCEHGEREFRKCPYCGLIWTKRRSCSGDTTCGNEDPTVSDTGDGKLAVFGTFSFAWECDKLTIKKKSKKDLKKSPMFGCGKTINWKDMATVELPEEFSSIIQPCSTGSKVDPSSEWRFFGRFSQRTREFRRWITSPWKSSTTR